MRALAIRLGTAASVLGLAVATTHSAGSRAAIVPDDRGAVLLSVRDDEGRPLTARARIEPSTWAERVRLGALGVSGVSERIVAGYARVSLVAGTYRLLVSHGPEWSLHAEDVRIAAGVDVARGVALRREIELPGWRGADFHLHTRRSRDAEANGGVEPADLRAEGVELAVATDHNHIGDLGAEFGSVPGAEVTTWAPEVGHFNAFPVTNLPAWRATSPARLIAELARDRSVFVQINHPRLEPHIAYFALGGFDGARGELTRPGFHLDVDGLEVWNGYDIGRIADMERVLSEWRGLIARGRRITATGGSDSHGAPGHHPGYPRTYVRAEAASGLASALKAGHAFVSNGPLLMLSAQGAGPGEPLRLREGRPLAIELTVLAPSWMRVERAEIWAGERVIWRADIPVQRAGEPLRFSVGARLHVRDARTLLAVVRGGRGLEQLLGRSGIEPFAFTNPIYLAPALAQQAKR